MNAEQFRRVKDVFREACDLDAMAQRALLARVDDTAVRDAVARMLDQDDAPSELPDVEIIRGSLDRIWDSSSDEPPIPERIGEYRILRVIGEGGMGTVYEAEQERPHRVVALKLLSRGGAGRSAMQRFRREIELLGQLHHPGIAQIHEAGTARLGAIEQPFFTMELVRGDTLSEFATRHRLDVDATLELIARLCDAVQHAHQHGIIHRDLKPANVLVDDAIPGGQPKVLDFGVARALETDVQATTMQTDVGQLVGTLRYMSPEQASGDPSAIDVRSDVYAIGIIAYELLTGAPPYEVSERSIADAVRVIQDEEPSRIVDRALRGDVETIMMKALEKDRERRYQSARELAADIRRHLDHRPIVARPATTMYQLRKFARRNRALVGGAVATMLALVAGMIGVILFALRAADESAAARWQSYRLGIGAADRAILDDDLPAARRLLEQTPEEHRGWTWRYLDRRTRRWLADIEAGEPIEGGLRTDPARGEILAMVGADRIRTWRVGTWEMISTRRFERGVSNIALRSSDGIVAVAGDDGSITLWDRRTDATRLLLDSAEGEIQSVRFSPDGTRILARRDETLVLCDAETGEGITTTVVGAIRGLCPVSDSAERVAFAIDDRVVEHDLVDGTRRTLLSTTERPHTLELHPDRRRLAIGTHHQKIYVVDLVDGATTMTLDAARGMVRDLAFASGGDALIALGDDGLLRFWGFGIDDAPTRTLDAADHEPVLIQIDEDADIVVSRAAVGTESRLRVWPLTASIDVLSHSSYVYSLACSPDGSTLAAGVFQDETVLWRVDETPPRPLGRLPGGHYDMFCTTLSFSPDGSVLNLREAAWMTADLRTPAGRGNVGQRFSRRRTWSADRRIFAEVECHSGDPMGRLILKTAPDGDEVHRLCAYELETTACAFAPDDVHLATVHFDGAVRIWNVDARTEVATLVGHAGAVYSVAYHPDGALLATGGADATIAIWDVRTGDQLLTLRGHDMYVHDLVWSPDGARLYSASGDGTVRIWDAAE